MNKLNSIIAIALLAVTFTSCKKDDEPVVVIPASDGSTLTLNGLIGTEAGSSAGNSVYVDFSTDKQVAINRASWDLGFYGGEEFRVILNHSVGATAIVLDSKTDLNQVTAQDTIALATSAALALGQGAGGFGLVDAVEGSKATYLNGTVIKEVSATEANNKVYIVNRGSSGVTGNRGWQKIRVLRNGNGYTLQYAKINETTFKTLSITKDANYNFKAISFVNGAVNVEPQNADWDILWSLSTYKASATIPYTFSDFVILNFLAGAQAAEVLTSTVSYADFKESNLAAVTFKSERDVIAGNWRITSGTPLGVKTDRFYLVKDGSGNVYKLKFNSFISNDGGERGKPVIEYKLVKKA